METHFVDKSEGAKSDSVCGYGKTHLVDFYSIPMRGIFEIFRDGESIYRDSNVIVLSSKKILAYLMSADRLSGQDPVSDYVVKYMRFGNCAYTNSQVPAPPDPAITDTGLVGTALFSTEVDVVSITNPPDSYDWFITFRGVMGNGQGAGTGYQNYTEAILCSENGTTLARKTFPSIMQVASPPRSYTVLWSIGF